MTCKIGAQFQCRHLQEGRRPWVHNTGGNSAESCGWTAKPANIGAAIRQIPNPRSFFILEDKIQKSSNHPVSQKFSHLQWRRLFKESMGRPTTTADFRSSIWQIPHASNICLLEDKIQDRGMYLFTISYGSCAMDQRSGDGWISGWSQVFVFCKRNSNAKFWSTRCEDRFSTEQNHPWFSLQEKGQSGGTKKPRSSTVSFTEDRSLTWSTKTSRSLEPMIPLRIMPTYLQLFLEMMIFRNSIRNDLLLERIFQFWNVGREDCVRSEQDNPEFPLQEEGQSRGTESPPVSTRKTDRFHDLRQLPGYWRSWYRSCDVQEFDTRWDEALLSMSKVPSNDVLESLYKFRIHESDHIKTVLELYDMEIHQKISMPNNQKLKTMATRSIDQKLR